MSDYVNMTFSNNIITGCNEGVRILRSHGNVISDNLVMGCYYNTGLGFDWAFNNTINHNTIIHNHYGISGGYDCYNNTYSENIIINNDIGFGTTVYDSRFFHNNFVDNGVNVMANGINHFDNGCEGNFWSDYIGIDSDGDGVGDTPYIIDGSNQDNCPLMSPYMPGDINHDAIVDIFDAAKIAGIFSCSSVDPQWNPHCDVNEDNLIDIFDLVTV